MWAAYNNLGGGPYGKTNKFWKKVRKAAKLNRTHDAIRKKAQQGINPKARGIDLLKLPTTKTKTRVGKNKFVINSIGARQKEITIHDLPPKKRKRIEVVAPTNLTNNVVADGAPTNLTIN